MSESVISPIEHVANLQIENQKIDYDQIVTGQHLDYARYQAKLATWDYVMKKTKKRTWQTSKWVYCPKCREMHKPIIKF